MKKRTLLMDFGVFDKPFKAKTTNLNSQSSNRTMNILSSILFVGIFSMTVVGQLVHEASTNVIRSDVENEYTITTVANVQDNSLQDESDCICTPFNLCKTYVSAPNGEELIDIRSPFGPCDSYLDVCCNDTKLASTEDTNLSNTDNGQSCICIGQEEHKPNKEQSSVEFTSSTPAQKPFDESSPLSLGHYATPKEENKHTSEKPSVEFTPSYPENFVTSKEQNKHTSEKPSVEFTPSYPENFVTSKEQNKHTSEKPSVEFTPSYPENFVTSKEQNKHTSEKPSVEYTPSYPDHFVTSKEQNKHTSEKPSVEYTPSYPDHYVTSKEENKYNTEYPLDSYTPSTTVHLTSSEKEYEQNTDEPIKTVTSTNSGYHSIKEDNENKHSEKTKCGTWNRNGVGFRIVNAIDGESQYGEFPSMIAILKEDVSKNGEKKLTYHCGGSLIEDNVVLTAAHCVIKKDPSTMVIRAGEWDLETDKEVYPHQDRRVKKIVTHSEYYSGGLHNDIALIFTDEPYILHNHVNTICLPEKNDNFVSKTCLSSGWGSKVFYNNYTMVKKTKSGKTKITGQYQVNILKKVELKVIDSEKCLEALRSTRLGPKFILHDSFLCAGGEEGKDTCKGDGGSPLMCQYGDDSSDLVQVGIVAWGINCGTSGVPAVYVDVAHFSQWIQDQIKNYTMQ